MMLFAMLLLFSGFGQTPDTASISGTVTLLGSNTPVSDAEIIARSGGKSKSVTADPNGRYKLVGLSPGTFHVTAYSRQERDASAALTVSLSGAQEFSGADFHLRGKASIAGKILDENGEPVAGAQVVLVAREYQLGVLRHVYAGVADSDDRGQYLLKDVEPGRGYFLLVRKVDRKLSPVSEAPSEIELRKKVPVPTWYGNTPDMSGAEPIEPRTGEHREQVDIQMKRSRAYCIDGVGQAGGHAGPLMFQIEEKSASSGRWGDRGFFITPPGGTLGADGRFRICNLTPGSYQLTAENVGKGGNAPVFYGSSTVNVVDKDVHQVPLESYPKIAVPGEVIVESNGSHPAPAFKVNVNLTPITRAPWMGEFTGLSLESSAPGQFSFPGLLADSYSVAVHDVPEDFYIKDVAYAGASILHAPLEVGRSTGSPDLRITLGHDGGNISLQVVDKDGKAVPEMAVLLVSEELRANPILAADLTPGQTDQNGSYTSPTLAPGKYRVLVSSIPFDRTPESIDRLQGLLSRAPEVSVTANGTARVTATSTEE